MGERLTSLKVSSVNVCLMSLHVILEAMSLDWKRSNVISFSQGLGWEGMGGKLEPYLPLNKLSSRK